MTFDRRDFFALAAVSLLAESRGNGAEASPPNAAEASPLIFITPQEAEKARAFARREKSTVVDRLASEAMAAGPWSVTWRRPEGLGVSAGAHDYVSEGPYWWPDPKNPTGPYIRKDGERNPGRFLGNRNDLGKMTDSVLALGMGAFLLGKTGCAEHANRVLGTWFVDPATRMNPNLEFGQMVRGVNTGRGTGIIDTVGLIHAAQGAVLLEAAGGLDSGVAAGMRQWFGDYLNWMNSSQKGKDEKKSGNNHATWWTAQAATYAAFTRNSELLNMCWEHYRTYLVPTEIEPNGSCPREEARTASLSYSSMNLDAFATVCRVAQMAGVELWHFQAPTGGSVVRAFHYLMPYVERPDRWKKEQINKYSADG